MKILIAEDEDVLRDLVARALSEQGHRVTATADGTEALEALESSDGAFDVLLADIKMPRMDGIALALATVSAGPDACSIVRIILIRKPTQFRSFDCSVLFFK